MGCRLLPLVTVLVVGLVQPPAADGIAPAVAKGVDVRRTSAPAAADRVAPVRYRAPITPTVVVTPFRPPSIRYGSGHLGVDLASRLGDSVRSAGDGQVSFAGPVAGRSLVVVAHADGLRTEYEPLRPTVGVGQHVSAGQVLGVVDGSHRGCPGACLHWGARRGDRYLDPLSLLAPLGPVRLLPWRRG